MFFIKTYSIPAYFPECKVINVRKYGMKSEYRITYKYSEYKKWQEHRSGSNCIRDNHPGFCMKNNRIIKYIDIVCGKTFIHK